MKKIIFLLVALNFFAVTINAQKEALNGIWKLADSYEYEGKTYTTNMNITFKDPGVIEISGKDLGTWAKNESENTLTITSDLLQGIQGKNKIETLNDTELKLLDSNGKINTLQRMSLPEGKELNNKFTGEWLFEKVEADGKTEFVGQIMDFNKNGIFYMQGLIFGKWNYKQASEKIIFDITEEKDKMNGEHSILKANETEFNINVNDAILYFSKMDIEKIEKENANSGFIGTWKLNSEDNPKAVQILTFEAPDTFVLIDKESGMQSQSKGTWIFNKSDKTVMMIGFSMEHLKGISKAIYVSDNELSLENNGIISTFKKEENNTATIEKLTFTAEDFYTENGDYKYEMDEEKSPWNNWSELKMGILNIHQLVYKYSKLINGTTSFEHKTLTANVHATSEEEMFSIDNVFVGFDSYNVPENAEFYSNEFDGYSKLYPIEGDTFRVKGEETITTPAGTFNCTVIETVNGDERKKLWMINDKLGVYAKIIDENPDEMFGHYYIYELQEIK